MNAIRPERGAGGAESPLSLGQRRKFNGSVGQRAIAGNTFAASAGLTVLLFGVLASAAPAAKPTPPETAPAETSRPWADGVSEQDQAQAMALFREGNGLLKDSVFVQAAQKYRDALKHWDHPAIHYNLVLALLNLDQPVEVHQHLTMAMKHGPAPLDMDKFEQARAYLTLIEKQLAKVSIRCDVEGANVVMDGRPLFVAPGHYEALVRAGPHTIVATREGYLTNETSPTLAAGQTTSFDLRLFTSDDLTRYKRRWPTWMPWVVVAAGAAVGGTGGLLHDNARNEFRAFDAGIDACGGCIPGATLQQNRTQGNTLQTMAFVSYGVGAAAVATGATLVYLNRLEPYKVKPEDLQIEAVSVVPVVGRGEGGVMATVRF